MTRAILCAAIAASTISFAAPAQAMMADPGLNATAPASVQLTRWHHFYRRHYHHHWWNSYAYSPHRDRHCWTEFRWGHWVRRCSW
jgi:hypothetical protein